MEIQKEKIFEKIITDYGRNTLKIIQLPQNSRLLSQILKEEDKDFPYQIISYLNLLNNNCANQFTFFKTIKNK